MLNEWLAVIKNILKKINIFKDLKIFTRFFKNMDTKELNIVSQKVDFLKDRKCYTDYAYDILNTYFMDEKRRIVVSGKNHQNLRDYLIEVIKCFARNRRYAFNTVHLAVLYLDIYMDSYILSTVAEHQKFIALVALMLASKIEENDENVPSIKELLFLVDLTDELDFDLKHYKTNEDLYKPEQVSAAFKSYMNLYCTIEYMIFRTLEFNAIRPTAMTFLNVFQNIAVTDSDLSDVKEYDPSIRSLDDIKYHIHQYLKLLSEVLLHDINFHQFLPSKVAAAMIASLRKLLKIKRIWTLQLEFLTHASLQEIEPIIDMFLDKLLIMEGTSTTEDNCDIVDSGFQSFIQDDSFGSSLELLSDEEFSDMRNCKKLKTDF